MTTINIPQRLKQIIERQVFLDYDRVYDEAFECLDNDNLHNPTHYRSHYSYNENFSTVLCATIMSHDEDCKDAPYGASSEECECSNKHLIDNITLTFRIKYNDRVIHTQAFDITELKNFGIGVEESDFPKHFAHRFFETIPDSVILCDCGERADDKANGKCRRCYLESHIRTEEQGGDCSICLQNEGGVWFKTRCNHFFHKLCLLKALERKRVCPWCRAVISNCIHAGGGQDNPYNVAEAVAEAE